MKLQVLTGEFPETLLAGIEAGEAVLIRELMERGEVALVATDGETLAGYAVFGFDLDNMVTVYAARACNGFLAKAAMIGIFGASQIIGAPMRVHTEKLRAMAKMLGAQIAIPARDTDGVPMGIFGNVV